VTGEAALARNAAATRIPTCSGRPVPVKDDWHVNSFRGDEPGII